MTVIIGALVDGLGALLIFIFGGLSALASYPLLKRSMGYLSAILGLIIVDAFVLTRARVDFGLGYRVIERLTAYPLFLWTIGMGAHLRFSKKLQNGGI